MIILILVFAAISDLALYSFCRWVLCRPYAVNHANGEPLATQQEACQHPID